jgi:hypothetical protein
MIPTPPRRRGVEYLDLPDVEPGLAERSIADVTVANRLFGGTRAVLAELAPVLAAGGPRPRCSTSARAGRHFPPRARALAARRGVRLVTIGLDSSEELARASRRGGGSSVRGDAMRLPFAEEAWDVEPARSCCTTSPRPTGAALSASSIAWHGGG